MNQDDIEAKAVEIAQRAIAFALRKMREAERERCAKIADRLADHDTRKNLGAGAVIAASQIAAAIRKRETGMTEDSEDTQVAALRQALKPFAEAREHVPDWMDDMPDEQAGRQSIWDTEACQIIKAGDLRRAAKVYQETGNAPESAKRETGDEGTQGDETLDRLSAPE